MLVIRVFQDSQFDLTQSEVEQEMRSKSRPVIDGLCLQIEDPSKLTKYAKRLQNHIWQVKSTSSGNRQQMPFPKEE